MPWEFARDGKEVRVRVEGQLTINALRHRIDAAKADLGLIYLPEDTVSHEIADGRLVRILEAWCDVFPGYYLYYPSRRPQTTAFSLFVAALRANRETPPGWLAGILIPSGARRAPLTTASLTQHGRRWPLVPFWPLAAAVDND